MPSFEGDEDDFERLARDVYTSEGLDVDRFSARGKDGGIDLIVDEDVRHVFECKLIGDDGVTAASARWKTVAGNIDKHLESPDGPSKGQSQYRPWYRDSPPIRKYSFCVSSRLKNQAQVDELQDEIQEFFDQLAERPHLAHLRGLEVEVRDWFRMWTRLERRPHLKFRWFPTLIPRGLQPLETRTDRSTFRAYLSSDVLPHYSFTQHLRSSPNRAFVDEPALLDRLFENSRRTCLLITGAGGVGKSRLAMEICRLAESRGDVALLTGRATAESLEELARQLGAEDRAVLLVEYVETQRHFEELVEAAQDIEERSGLAIRIVATCRTTFYDQVAHLDGSERLDLSPRAAEARAWLADYRVATIRHILKDGGAPASSELVDLCKGRPALAVFVSYLKAHDHSLDLGVLYSEPSFGSWFRRQVQKTFHGTSTGENLALWNGLLPLPEPVPSGLRETLGGELFGRLATDRWIETADDGGPRRWFAAHDLLADQLLLSYIDSIRQQEQRFVERWLDTAQAWGCLESALTALQRLAGADFLAEVDLVQVFKRQLELHPESWWPFRELLLQTPLLGPAQVIDLLDRELAVWSDSAESRSLARALGRFARSAAPFSDELTAARRRKLTAWLSRSLDAFPDDSFLLPRAISFSFQSFKPQVLKWLTRFGTVRDAQFVLASWLRSGGEPTLVRRAVIDWCREHTFAKVASFVLQSWLDATEDYEAVRKTTMKWLEAHGETEDAKFVLKSWLDASGDFEAVRKTTMKWLEAHGETEDAQFVLRSWLDASGDFEAARKTTMKWLEAHGETEDATFVLHGWLDASGDFEAVRKTTMKWLEAHGETEDAQFVLRSWLDASGDMEAVRSTTLGWLESHGQDLDADFVMRSWLEAGGEFRPIRRVALDWLAIRHESKSAVFLTKRLVKEPWLPPDTVRHILLWCLAHPQDEDAVWRLSGLGNFPATTTVHGSLAVQAAEEILSEILTPGFPIEPGTVQPVQTVFFLVLSVNGVDPKHRPQRASTDRLFASWFRRQDTFSHHPKVPLWMQKPSWGLKLIDLLEQRLLSMDGDAKGIGDWLRWTQRWESRMQHSLSQVFRYLRSHYPSPLWDDVG